MNKLKSIKEFDKLSKKGQSGLMAMPINLLVLFITVTFLIALIPAFVEMQDMAQQSDSMNCPGFVYHGSDCDGSGCTLSYNATLKSKSTIGCMSIKLYLPYIVLGVLISGVALIFYGRQQGGQVMG